MQKSLLSKYLAEFIGTMLLVCAIVGSGIMATNLTPDVGLQLLVNALATIFALSLLIFVFSDASGSHFNPVVTLTEFIQGRISLVASLFYCLAQFCGGAFGTVVANLMYNQSAISTSAHIRNRGNYFLSEVVATAGLLFVINRMNRENKSKYAPLVVAAWIGSAYFFTSSTSFANPAVTLARSFTNSFSGIAHSSVLPFIAAQVIGALVGVGLSMVISSASHKEGSINGK